MQDKKIKEIGPQEYKDKFGLDKPDSDKGEALNMHSKSENLK